MNSSLNYKVKLLKEAVGSWKHFILKERVFRIGLLIASISILLMNINNNAVYIFMLASLSLAWTFYTFIPFIHKLVKIVTTLGLVLYLLSNFTSISILSLLGLGGIMLGLSIIGGKEAFCYRFNEGWILGPSFLITFILILLNIHIILQAIITIDGILLLIPSYHKAKQKPLEVYYHILKSLKLTEEEANKILRTI
jgi:uncharacterized integral membrane protein